MLCSAPAPPSASSIVHLCQQQRALQWYTHRQSTTTTATAPRWRAPALRRPEMRTRHVHGRHGVIISHARMHAVRAQHSSAATAAPARHQKPRTKLRTKTQNELSVVSTQVYTDPKYALWVVHVAKVLNTHMQRSYRRNRTELH